MNNSVIHRVVFGLFLALCVSTVGCAAEGDDEADAPEPAPVVVTVDDTLEPEAVVSISKLSRID